MRAISNVPGGQAEVEDPMVIAHPSQPQLFETFSPFALRPVHVFLAHQLPQDPANLSARAFQYMA